MTEFVGIAVILAVCTYVLDTLGFGGTRLYLAFGSVLLLLVTLEGVKPIIEEIIDLYPSELSENIGTAALRVLGIGYIGGFFADFCQQLGAKAASDGLNLFTRVQMLSVVMPYFLDVLRSVGELLK